MADENDRRARLQLRVSPEIREAVRDYAAQTGMNLNAAAIALIREGLRTERERRDTP